MTGSLAEFANRPGFLHLMNALKQLGTAGVRVFFYLEDRERHTRGKHTRRSAVLIPRRFLLRPWQDWAFQSALVNLRGLAAPGLE